MVVEENMLSKKSVINLGFVDDEEEGENWTPIDNYTLEAMGLGTGLAENSILWVTRRLEQFRNAEEHHKLRHDIAFHLWARKNS